MRWIDHVTLSLETHDRICLAVVSRIEGSTPRELGAFMVITETDFSGTIGGGTLEHDVLYQARVLLQDQQASRGRRFWRNYPLGPSLGQCCGGFVSVMIEEIDQSDFTQWQEMAQNQSGYSILPDQGDANWHFSDQKTPEHGLALPLTPQTMPFYLYGAGHVGRAVMEVTSGLPLDRFWVDTDQSRFPDHSADDITIIPAADPAQIAPYAPAGAIHMIMSYSHQLDLDICAALLKAGNAAHIGLIGSKTKRARFRSRLTDLGFTIHQIDQIICPIGLPEIQGKEPARVALSIAGQLAQWTYQETIASTRQPDTLIPLKRTPS